ncbi:hypothetical protein [Yeosuana marina]|uniref:hypothetical protein n=1 Tax=Yeosuana marina TaxID=1565536 RepID=UPI0030EEA90E|tara:strand:+ start:701 stop:2902 length:2202 start_codon:yes stop_codon:yes gene_type:complete
MKFNFTITKLIAFTILFLSSVALSNAQTSLYNETFTANNGTTSTSNWSSNNYNTSWLSPFDVNNNQMRSFYSQGEDVWTSSSIDISNYTDLNISLDVSVSGWGINSSDYISAYYSIDGGNEVLIQSKFNNFSDTTITLSNLQNNGYSNLTIIVKLRNDGFKSHTFDNVNVTGTLLDAIWRNNSWVNGVLPSSNKMVTIDDDFNTGIRGSFSCKELTVNAGKTLTVDNETYVEVENDAVINGDLIVETKGAFVQVNDNGTFTGTGHVNKTTANKNAWYYYTFWGSPVANMTVAEAFPNVSSSRRFYFEASNFLDANNDNFDDDGNDWQIAPGNSVMIPGVAYAVTSSTSSTFPGPDYVTFTGTFNTGIITTPIAYTGDANSEGHPNLIGNPYASAIDFDKLYAENSSVIEGTVSFWSQATPANSSGKFSQNDYATYSVGMHAGVAGASEVIPTQFIPSGQGVSLTAKADGILTFKNNMRVKGTTDNTQFFKSSNTKNTTNNIVSNKLWIDLKSNNGVFSQILVGYVDGATNDNDGLMYDSPKSDSGAALLYSTIQNSSKKYVIQGKNVNSLTDEEVIALGFKTKITEATVYTISIAQMEGDFLKGHTIYLKDNLLNTIHDLSANDYTFSSEVGEFNSRFEIVFQTAALSTDTATLESNTVKIFKQGQNQVCFKVANNTSIKSINIIDLQGRMLYKLKGVNNEETYNLPHLNQSIFIANIELSNGALVTKKAILN